MESRTLGQFPQYHSLHAAVRHPGRMCIHPTVYTPQWRQKSCTAVTRNVSQQCSERPANSSGTTTETSTSSSSPAQDESLEDLTRDNRNNSVDAEYERRQLNALRERKSWREGLSFKPESLNTARKSESFGESVQAVLDKVLIADFFFVCLALLLLIIGLGERVALNTSNIIDVWLPAWPLVVQPAIGVLMAGALLSGLAGWYRSDIAKDR